MNRKDLSIPFNAPLHSQDTELQTYGCIANNPDIRGNNGLPNICAFSSEDCICKKRHELGKSNMPNLKAKPLNYCLSYYSIQFYYLSNLILMLFFFAHFLI